MCSLLQTCMPAVSRWFCVSTRPYFLFLQLTLLVCLHCLSTSTRNCNINAFLPNGNLKLGMDGHGHGDGRGRMTVCWSLRCLVCRWLCTCAVPQATAEECKAAGIDIGYRDFCAHMLIGLNKCRHDTLYMPWKCTCTPCVCACLPMCVYVCLSCLFLCLSVCACACKCGCVRVCL